MGIANTYEESLEKRTFARRIYIKDKDYVFTGTILLDGGHKNFIGLGDDKTSRIFGTIGRKGRR